MLAKLTLLSLVGCFISFPAVASDSTAHLGAVFTMTDDAATNAVLAFARATDGSLTYSGSFPTGGAGSGGGEAVLGSQGSVALSGNGRFLLAVNAGSD
ncbi:MAG TPA: hypothetical protein VFG59_10895 [Anaeromyxobacter sp.]|nr:hypothetical protein [Anaeromyxobacter sp.]